MKRPLLLFFYSAVPGILLAYYGVLALWQICAASAAAIFALIRFSDGRRPRVFICAALSVVIFAAAFARMDVLRGRSGAALAFDGEYAAFTGVVSSCRQKDGYLSIYVRLDGIYPAADYLRLAETARSKGPQERTLNGSAKDPSERAVKDPSESAVKALSKWSEPVRGESVLLRLETDDASLRFDLPGRRVAFSGSVERPSGIRNLFGFDYSRYLRSRGVYSIVRCGRFRFQTGDVSSRFRHALSVSKGRFLSALRLRMEEDEFAVASGLIFGDRDHMDEDQYEQYRRSGISHILAVSGLHVGLLYSVINRLIKNRSIASDVLVCAVLFCYALLSELSVSVLRASIMVLLRMLAFRLKRRYDLVSAASLCALGFCLYDPYTVFDSGFQLSFAAAYAIGIALPWAELKITELSDRLRSERLYAAGMALAPGIMVQTAMLPLIVYDFLSFSPMSFAVNPFAVAVAGIELPAGMAAYVIFLIGGLAELLSLRLPAAALDAACGSIGAMSRILNLLSSFSSRFSRDICAPPFGILILYYMFFFFFFSDTRAMLSRRKLRLPLAGIAAGFILLSSIVPYSLGITLTPYPWRYSLPPLSFVDVGQGDCIHIHSGGADILVDGGGSFYSDTGRKTLMPYLRKNGVRKIDLAVVTHPDLDHAKGLEELSQAMPFGTLIYPAVYGAEDFGGIAAEEKLGASAGDVISAGDARLRVLLPGRSDPLSGEANSNCLVMMLETEGFRTLLTADMVFAMEERLLSEGADLSCDVLKAAHHGSAYSGSERFVLGASPLIEVISCGRDNAYGHPAARVIDLAGENGIIYARTDEDGAILIKGVRRGFLEVRNAAGNRKWLILTDRARLRNIRSKR